jgi:hypothetical protein
MADSKILATIERSETEQLQISLSEYKGTSYFSPIVENQHNMLSWIAVVLAIIAFCMGRL